MAHPSRPAPGLADRSRLRALRHGLATAAAVASLVLVMVVPGAPSANAEDQWGYPTWAEVEAARGNVTAKNAQIEQIRGLIAQLETEAVNAQALSDQKAAEAIEAQRVYD